MGELSTTGFMSETEDEARAILDELHVTPKSSDEYTVAVRNLKELALARSAETKRVVETYESLSRQRRGLDPNTVFSGFCMVGATLVIVLSEAVGNSIVTSKAPDIVSKVANVFKR